MLSVFGRADDCILKHPSLDEFLDLGLQVIDLGFVMLYHDLQTSAEIVLYNGPQFLDRL